VEDIHRQGGTILGSSRTNVAKIENGFEIVKNNLAEIGVDVLVAIGGDDTLGVAKQLHDAGGQVIGVPKTIDNDLSATDYTFGFDTAINRAAEALDRLHTTAKSHHRVFVVELMGRDAGWVALHGGIAGGAHIILIPEEPFDTDEVCEMIKKRHSAGHVYTVVAVAEGAMDPKLASRVMRFEEKDEFGNVQLSKGIGVAEALAAAIEEHTGLETRSMVLGHLQRGGEPSAFDRVLGTRLGLKVVDLIEEGNYGYMASLRGSDIAAVPIADAVGAVKKVSPERYEEAKTFFG
jgi:6-phosphofructokinase 1